MINVSDACQAAMEERRDFRLFAQVTLADGTELALDGEDFAVAGNSLTDGAGITGLPLGAAVSRQVRLEIVNDDERLDGYDLFGARVRLWLTLALDEGEERIEMGTFTVTEPAAMGETVSLTAWDDMIRTDRPYETDLTFPATLGSMYREICQRCAIPYDTARFPNEEHTVAAAPSGEDYTFRQVLGYIAMLAGGNARVDRTGRMRILPYGMAAEPALALTEWSRLKAATDDIAVTGLAMTAEETDEAGQSVERTVLYGREGYVLEVENPLVPPGGELEALALMGAGLVGLPFRPFEGEHAALPMAEFMDTASVTDRKGRTFVTVLTDVTVGVGGYTSLANSAEQADRGGSRYVTPRSQARQAARELVQQERTARQAAVEQLARTLAESGGMYSTAQPQPDGSVIYYLHDKPTLAASGSVMKLTAEAIGFSTDGGRSWPFGFSVNGEMVMGIIRAEGLSADWVQFGTMEQARVEGLPQMASELQVMREEISATVSRVESLGTETITEAEAEFYLSDSPVSLSGGQWSGTQPVWQAGKYIWTRQKVTRGDGSAAYTPSETGVCITGNTGAQGPAGEDGAPGKDGAAGAKGDTGVGVSAVEAQYYLSTSGDAPVGGTWEAAPPEITEGTCLWTRNAVTYTDGNVKYTAAYNMTAAVAGSVRPELSELEATLSDKVEYVQEQTASLTERADGITGTVSDIQQAVGVSSGQIQLLQGQISALQQTASALALRFDTVEVDHVTTSSGYTFNADGLDISKAGEQMHNQLTNLGMYVRRNQDVILRADASGVEATDVQINNFLLLGKYARFEDYTDGTDGKRTACFFVG